MRIYAIIETKNGQNGFKTEIMHVDFDVWSRQFLNSSVTFRHDLFNLRNLCDLQILDGRYLAMTSCRYFGDTGTFHKAVPISLTRTLEMEQLCETSQ